MASLDDVHSAFHMQSTFFASLGFAVDIYDDKPLIEAIDRLKLPEADFPFQTGDEVVSIDGVSAASYIEAVTRLQKKGNPVSTRRAAADLLANRPQSILPRAVEIGDTAIVVVKRRNGTEQTFVIPWTKSGVPIRSVAPSPEFKMAKESGVRAALAETDYSSVLAAFRNWSLPDLDPLLTRSPDGYLLGIGSRRPIFPMPAGFVQRLGTGSSDFLFSGTYSASGKRIGYLRIPTFAPPNAADTVRALDAEVEYLDQNTDALIVDVMRNPGGGCFLQDAARRLIPYTFRSFSEQFRVSQANINTFDAALRNAQRKGDDQGAIDALQGYLSALLSARESGRLLTDLIPSCPSVTPGSSSPGTFDTEPAAKVYTKPLIVVTDEFSVSAAEIFASMIQDARRGPIVGARTMGAGGLSMAAVSGVYSESVTTYTATLVVRPGDISVPGYPTTRYIENVGVQPDIAIPYMTLENLLAQGRVFMNALTQAILSTVQ